MKAGFGLGFGIEVDRWYEVARLFPFLVVQFSSVIKIDGLVQCGPSRAKNPASWF